MTAAQPSFTVSRRGLAKLLERRGDDHVTGIVFELYQNAVDNGGTRRVDLDVQAVPGRPQAVVTVSDDHPDGFRDLSHAWTLFAESERKSDPTKRGRFCMGEKMVAALALTMTIETTTGTVTFGPEGRTVRPRRCREVGSVVTATVRATREQVALMEAAVARLIPPDGVEVYFRGERLTPRAPVATVPCTLPTEVADAEGVMRRRDRATTVRAYEAAGETAWLYELGIPVVALPDDRFDLDVGQKIPLTMERDNVPAAYLRSLRVHTANALAALIVEADAHRPWVRDAMGDTRASDELVKAAVRARFGERVVSYDPSDPEANKTAVASGYVVVHGGQLSGEQWQNVRRSAAMLPAGRVTPSAKPYGDGPPVQRIPREAWSPAQEFVAAYATMLAIEMLGVPVEVVFDVNPSGNYLANFGSLRLAFNAPLLGDAWFERALVAVGEEHDDLLLHELGHHHGGHLDTDYHDALTRFGARLRRVGNRCESAARAAVRGGRA